MAAGLPTLPDQADSAKDRSIDPDTAGAMTLGFATFDRYVMRHYLMWFAVTLAVLICVAFLMEFIEMLRRTADVDDVTLQTALLLSALAVPQPIELMFQFAVLFGAMLAFWRLTRSRELVVARASGISVWRFLFPVVLAALLTGGPLPEGTELLGSQLGSSGPDAVPTCTSD